MKLTYATEYICGNDEEVMIHSFIMRNMVVLKKNMIEEG